eukprot:TRINITY_DN19236_c0_g1_i1.p1 TRINITY_DN19236_c0_g1~~TRINITY_DN19236_c0_g1_i1.p1  ORF type:complete len:556 (-),score=54.67 TRINITY_DN19236_c0_g1_i1:378-2045(-)
MESLALASLSSSPCSPFDCWRSCLDYGGGQAGIPAVTSLKSSLAQSTNSHANLAINRLNSSNRRRFIPSQCRSKAKGLRDSLGRAGPGSHLGKGLDLPDRSDAWRHAYGRRGHWSIVQSGRGAPAAMRADGLAFHDLDKTSSLNNQPSSQSSAPLSDDHRLMLRAVEVASSSLGITVPHPNMGCVLARPEDGRIVGEGSLRAQGAKSAEVEAVEQARDAARGATAYLNLESGDCHGDHQAVDALIQGGVSRVVIGMRHPLPHLHGAAITRLRRAGIRVEVLGEGRLHGEVFKEIIEKCRAVNEPLIYRAFHRIPFSILKYAMTLDGKIAATTGHAAWVTSPIARQRVFATRALSDAIIVGGNTVRRDDPQLTTRRDSGHRPVRIVMSRTLHLPEDARLWDVTSAPTILMTQRGAREDFQHRLRNRGVEVVDFDFLTPSAVMEYCYARGFLQVLWECGGMLSAPAIAAGVIHKVMAFVAPKVIGGTCAPTPVGDLGFVEMTQALNLSDVCFEQLGPDLLVSGYLHAPPAEDYYPPLLPATVNGLLEASERGIIVGL